MAGAGEMAGGESSRERDEPKLSDDRELGEPFRLLFVCTGNTCRSPMAHALAEHELAERGWEQVEVRSAGVAAWAGAPASGGAVRVAGRRGLDLHSHRSTPLTPELLEWADLVLTMSPRHLASVDAMGGEEKSAVITEFAREDDREGGPAGVRDPIGGDDREYEATFEELRELVDRVLGRIAPLVSP